MVPITCFAEVHIWNLMGHLGWLRFLLMPARGPYISFCSAWFFCFFLTEGPHWKHFCFHPIEFWRKNEVAVDQHQQSIWQVMEPAFLYSSEVTDKGRFCPRDRAPKFFIWNCLAKTINLAVMEPTFLYSSEVTEKGRFCPPWSKWGSKILHMKLAGQDNQSGKWWSQLFFIVQKLQKRVDSAPLGHDRVPKVCIWNQLGKTINLPSDGTRFCL